MNNGVDLTKFPKFRQFPRLAPQMVEKAVEIIAHAYLSEMRMCSTSTFPCLADEDPVTWVDQQFTGDGIDLHELVKEKVREVIKQEQEYDLKYPDQAIEDPLPEDASVVPEHPHVSAYFELLCDKLAELFVNDLEVEINTNGISHEDVRESWIDETSADWPWDDNIKEKVKTLLNERYPEPTPEVELEARYPLPFVVSYPGACIGGVFTESFPEYELALARAKELKATGHQKVTLSLVEHVL